MSVDLVNDTQGVALGGYDVVAYFKSQKAVKGLKKWSSVYQNHQYYFSSKENQELFDKDPSSYVPIYGGWCSWAVSYGKIGVPVDYNEFFIKKDSSGKERLFLFFTGTLRKWEKENHREQLKKADKTWEKSEKTF